MNKILIILIIFSFPFITIAWENCPHKEVNCPAPGECAKYTDTDNDNICDLSQPAPQDRKEAAMPSTIKNNAPTQTDRFLSAFWLILLPILSIIIYGFYQNNKK